MKIWQNAKKKASKKKKQQQFRGHYCKVCGEHKANEKFSGKGHAIHICKSCASKSPEQKSEDMTINKLHRMAYRFVSKEEMNWLKNRMNDSRPEVKELARAVYGGKFPNYERNEIKKTLKITNLDFHVCGEIWDSYGDEYFVNIEFTADTTGKIIRKSFDENNNISNEKTIEIGQSSMRKLFNVAVHNYNIFFWDNDLCEEISYDPDIDILPEFLDDDYEEDFEDFDEPEQLFETDTEVIDDNSVPTWSVEVKYKNGPVQNTKGYDFIPDDVMSLFIEFEDYFEDELSDFDIDDDID